MQRESVADGLDAHDNKEDRENWTVGGAEGILRTVSQYDASESEARILTDTHGELGDLGDFGVNLGRTRR